jgi:transposase-like protein
MKNKCLIRAERKLRNGDPNWWCFTHFASARGKNGKKLKECLKANIPVIKEEDKIYIDLDEYLGGVGIWGSLEAVYDSKREAPEKGVHVHLRRNVDGEKVVDKTFKEVFIKVPPSTLIETEEWVKIDEHIACAYTASIVFEKKLKVIKCKYCYQEHVDAEYFAVHSHKKHFCTYCGREFLDSEHGISNPIFYVQELFKEKLLHRRLTKVKRKLIINQKDYPGGIQIWGSNPAIIWTAKRKEEGGIHVHLFKSKVGEPDSDDTYGYVEIDGIVLDDVMIRYYMVQKSLSYLAKYIVSLVCPECGGDHFDEGDNAINPHKTHICEHCSYSFNDNTRFKGVVSNPILARLKQLDENRKRK